MDELRLGTRIVVVGPPGAGKTTLAERIADRVGLSLIELDAVYWRPGWSPNAPELFRQEVAAATAGERWVVAGNYSVQRDISWPRAHSVVWLDLPLPLCVGRVALRSLRRWATRELIWGTNRERLLDQLMLWDPGRSLVAYMLRNKQVQRERYRSAMADPEWSHLTFHRLTSSAAVAQWMRRTGVCDPRH